MNLLSNLMPDEVAGELTDIEVKRLTRLGYKALLLDLDNTLTLWRSRQVSEPVRQWARKASEAGLQLCLVSNAQNPDRVEAVARELGCEFIARAKKPMRRGFSRACMRLGVEPGEAVAVGDQLLTDVWGGNRAGLHTVLLRPIDRKREFVGTKFDRLVERLVLRLELKLGLVSQDDWFTLWPEERPSKEGAGND